MPWGDRLIANILSLANSSGASVGFFVYTLLFLFLFFEAIPLLGNFLPSGIWIAFAGFLARLGIVNSLYVVIISVAGIFLGDLMGYYLGKKYGYHLLSRYGKYILLNRDALEKTKKLVHENTGKAIFLGKFNPLTRCFVAFVSGASEVPLRKFLPWGFLCACSLTIVLFLIGFLFGQSYKIISKYFGIFGVIGLLGVIFIFYVYKILNANKHIVEKYQVYSLISCAVGIFLFFKMLDDVDYSQIITVWDSWINSHISMIWNPILNKIMILVSAVFSPGIIIAVSSGICLYLFLNKRKNYFILWILSLLSGLSYMFIKELVQRARPENFLVQNSGYSFPSGHATLAIIFFSLILYTFKDKIQNLTIKELFIGLNVFMILLVGFSRIYLGVHWLSDIIAGFGLGLFCVSFYVLIIKIIKSIKNKRNSRVTN